MYALFVKIAGKWRFEGYAEYDEAVFEFEESVVYDIEETKNEKVKTEAFFTVELPN